ncbi:MAG: 2-hydroxychromene-2-carboxylate isomerase [Rhizobiaceae bacterium]|nr:2-hydroxychromene-2-carboxylate isomerase [Rhizobiaceae bacterium]
MSDHIDYYFTCPSPFAYLGLNTLLEIAQKHGKSINYKPFNIMEVWAESGAVPPGQRPPVRQRYRSIEVQRVGVMRNVTINPAPKYFPTDQAPSDHTVCALVIAGEDPADFCRAVGKAIWEQEQQIADEDVLSRLLSECGHDAAKILEIANSDAAAAARSQNSKDAIAADAVGAPAYVYNGEVFWGQDRLEYLDQMISSGRPAFSA